MMGGSFQSVDFGSCQVCGKELRRHPRCKMCGIYLGEKHIDSEIIKDRRGTYCMYCFARKGERGRK